MKMIQVCYVLSFALIVIVIMPLAMLWSLNTLFPVVAIPYNFETWCACTVFSALFLGKQK